MKRKAGRRFFRGLVVKLNLFNTLDGGLPETPP
ncbi:hypothetical protein MXAN_2725 [Myxococcus xanthus DK 1622]|uniref:Uncharacterized protein n=1 Tax=Myxococcus xanthus (strain DK1622) TaxID=246197 RepID=Q1D8T1_MYXXD|nr:hypothetical protein MXAN_2725 [Myxococcus xanthus DK 1622]